MKYVAKVEGVRELALQGTADPGWWRERLAPEGLEPVEADGRAQVLVTGLDSEWKGIAFRDLSVTVAARRRSGLGEEAGFFFARAFVSSRFFATVERLWFHTPYAFRSDLRVDVASPASIQLGSGTAPDMHAELAARGPAPEWEMGFTGPLFLPMDRDDHRRRWMVVRIGGRTSTFEFDGSRDRFALGISSVDLVLEDLRASEFAGVRWHVRRNATHERSKTFQEPR